jgi:hypothetical protein
VEGPRGTSAFSQFEFPDPAIFRARDFVDEFDKARHGEVRYLALAKPDEELNPSYGLIE